MATLTGLTINDTYDSLLKTADQEALPATGKINIEDGFGNASSINIGRENAGAEVTGSFRVFGDVRGSSFSDVNTSINKFASTEEGGIPTNNNNTSLPTSLAVTDYVTNYVTNAINDALSEYEPPTQPTPNLQSVTDVGATTTNNITAASFIKSGGTATQFLMADGSTTTNPGWLTSFTETDTLDTVVGRNNTTTKSIVVGDVTGSTISFASLKDSGENITVSKFVDELDGITNNDNDTTIPTSAAVKDYVDNFGGGGGLTGVYGDWFNPGFMMTDNSVAVGYRQGDPEFDLFVNNSKYYKIGRQVTVFIDFQFSLTDTFYNSLADEATWNFDPSTLPFPMTDKDYVGGSYSVTSAINTDYSTFSGSFVGKSILVPTVTEVIAFMTIPTNSTQDPFMKPAYAVNWGNMGLLVSVNGSFTYLTN